MDAYIRTCMKSLLQDRQDGKGPRITDYTDPTCVSKSNTRHWKQVLRNGRLHLDPSTSASEGPFTALARRRPASRHPLRMPRRDFGKWFGQRRGHGAAGTRRPASANLEGVSVVSAMSDQP